MADAKFTPSSERTATYKWVLKELSEEQDRLYALASTISQRLEPDDPEHPKDDAPLNEWRLAQMLEERLGKTSFLDAISEMLTGDRNAWRPGPIANEVKGA